MSSHSSVVGVSLLNSKFSTSLLLPSFHLQQLCERRGESKSIGVPFRVIWGKYPLITITPHCVYKSWPEKMLLNIWVYSYLNFSVLHFFVDVLLMELILCHRTYIKLCIEFYLIYSCIVCLFVELKVIFCYYTSSYIY